MATEDARKLFVAGLPDSVTEEVLRGLFIESGAQVIELTVPRDRMSGRPRGFAFVRLGSEEETDRARQVLDGRIVDGRSISVRPFQAEPPAVRPERPMGGPPGAPGMGAPGPGGFSPGGYGDRPPRRDGPGGPAPDRTLYVGNLPYDATTEEIEAVLTELGAVPVLRVHLPLDQDGRKRGFGFVTLGSAEAAKNAAEVLKGAELRGRRLIINLAHPKGATPREGDGPSPDRPPRSFVGGGGGGPGMGPGPGGPPGFGPPPAFGGPPGGPASRGRDVRKKKGDDGEGRGAASKGRRDREESWRDFEDDD